jgi:hypothetical protein
MRLHAAAAYQTPNARLATPNAGAAAGAGSRSSTTAPGGKDYEIWVFEDGVPQRAGLFEGPGVAMLSRRVEPVRRSR